MNLIVPRPRLLSIPRFCYTFQHISPISVSTFLAEYPIFSFKSVLSQSSSGNQSNHPSSQREIISFLSCLLHYEDISFIPNKTPYLTNNHPCSNMMLFVICFSLTTVILHNVENQIRVFIILLIIVLKQKQPAST